MNSQVAMTLDEAVAELNGHLTGMDFQLVPEQDRYQSLVRQLNRGLRAVALANEWGYYSSLEQVGVATRGVSEFELLSSVRPRIMPDDSAKLIDPRTRAVVALVPFLPRDAINKYQHRQGLRVSVTRQTLTFSRPFINAEHGLEIHIPVMREPKMFRLPAQPTDPNAPLVDVPMEIREQLVDFDYPDLVILKAAYYYAQTDPVLQPRVMQLDDDYKELMYALIERDTNHNDSPYQNEWNIGIEGGISGHSYYPGGRGIADERGFSHGTIY